MSVDLDRWPFGTDADRDDPLTALRIAVTSSHPRWSYLVAFDRESEARPTDVEAAMLASLLTEYKNYWYENNWYRKQMEQRLLDVDGGANGLVFHKFGPDDWGYRRQSFQYGFMFTVVWPAIRDDPKYAEVKLRGPWSLRAVMDRIRSFGSEPNPRWEAWKAAHPEVFGNG